MEEVSPLIYIYYGGTINTLVPGGVDSRCYFGGPIVCHVESGHPLDEARLHHLGTLNLSPILKGSALKGVSIPLVFGICHENCMMEYSKTATNAIFIEGLEPAALKEGYPYEGYPDLLPYYRLGFGETSYYLPGELQSRLKGTGWSSDPGKLYIFVVQHPTIGHCLLDAADDAEIVFEYNPENGKIRATSRFF